MKKHIVLVFILTYFSSAFAATEHRPKIGLVLSGGGARGAAHIGVIEALEEMHVPIDLIVGTSMGAVIGGLYASGVPIQTIKHDFSHLDWDKVFSYNIERTDLYYRRKLDTDIFLIKNFISYSKGKIHIPYGIITGQSLYEEFNSYLLQDEPIKDFNHLHIPFKAVSTDLVTGKAIVLDHGDLALSLLASMAVPGIISPVDTNGYMLVDGGVSCNLPIEIAKQMGAEILIVVDVSTPMSTKAQIIDLAGVLGQLTNILTYKNIVQSKSLLTHKDILLTPKLDLDTSDFEDFETGIQPGVVAAYQHENQLRKLSSPNIKNISKVKQETVKIDEVMVNNKTKLLPSTYFHYLEFESQYVTPDDIKDHIDHLYGLSIFDRIYYGIESSPEGKRLVVEPKQDVNDPVYFQGSVLLDTDFQTTNTFGLVLGVTNEQVNSLMGELRLIAQVGHGEALFGEYYQPLTSDLSWFFNPSIGIQRTFYTGYFDFSSIATYLVTTSQLEFAFGKVFSNVARIKGYWDYDYNVIKLRTGCFDFLQNIFPNQLEEHVTDGSVGIALEWDTIDNLYFPHHGIKGSIDLSTYQKAFGGETEFSQLVIKNLAAASTGKHAFVLGTLYNRTLEDIPSFPNKFNLGGLYELTGLYNNEISGDNSALISAIYFYELEKLNIIPNRPLPIYTGFSLEAGKVWGETNLSTNRFIESASVFIAADSILGPIYLAAGATENGRKSVHLTLRPAFR